VWREKQDASVIILSARVITDHQEASSFALSKANIIKPVQNCFCIIKIDIFLGNVRIS